MWLPLGVGNVVCVNGVVYVWSDLFQSVLSPPFSGMLMKTGDRRPPVLSLVTASMTQFRSHPCSAYLEGTRSVGS